MRKVTRVSLHSNIFIGGGVGDLGNKLPTPGKTFDSFDMQLEGEHILVKASSKGHEVEFIIPLTNVQVCVLAADKPAKK